MKILLRCTLLPVFLLLMQGVTAQQKLGSVQGSARDSSSHQPLLHATVIVRDARDSVVVQSGFTNDKGAFRMEDIEPGDYRLMITYLGYQHLNKTFSVTAKNPDINLGNLDMVMQSVNLKTLLVEEQKPPVKILGDTIQFNAESFKTKENAMVEDLLKKLPGVEVDKDGNITAQGEQIQEILVDGKPFFGSDPKITTKNLPADIVDQIQLFDKGSDQAAFTGIKDGNTKKAINLIIKKNRRKGIFGRGTAGYGNNDRYQLNGMLNLFNNDQRISFLAGANNVNNMGFTFRDIRGSGGRGNPSGGGGNGITTSWMGGINYRDNWNPKLQVYGSYFVNHTHSNTAQKSSRQNIFKDSSTYYNKNAASNNESLDHRVNLNMEYTIDSMSSIIFRPNFSYTTNDYITSNSFESLSDKKTLVNDGTSALTMHNTSLNVNGNLLYRRRLKKKGRTFSVNISGGYSNNDGTSYNKSNTNYYQGAGSGNQTLDQQNRSGSGSSNWGVGLSYTEPIYKDHYLELEYAHNENSSSSDKFTYNFNPASKSYDQYDSIYSNAFRNTFTTDRGSINFVANKEKYTYNAGLSLQRSDMNSYSVTGDSSIMQKKVNFYPNFNFHYNFSQNSRLQLEYHGSTQQPSIFQLQTVRNNNDQINIMEGNANLKPSFSNNIRVNYNFFNPENYRSLFTSLNYSMVSNQIVNASHYNDSLQQIIQPVNVNGTYSLGSNTTLSIPVKQLHLRISPGTNINYSHNVGFVNGQKNYSRNWSLSQRLQLGYDPNDNLNLDISGRIGYNSVTYSLQSSQNQHYTSYALSADFEYRLPAGFLIGSDFDYSANSGLAAGYNLSVARWNAYIGKDFFKRKQAQLKFQVFDLLDQNVSITHSIHATSIQDTQNMVLSRYFLLTFTYNLNHFGGRRSGGGRMERSGGMERGGNRQWGGGRSGGGGMRR